jgi:hypothetical protein
MSTIALPIRPPVRALTGILAAAAASFFIGAGVISQDIEVDVGLAAGASSVTQAAYDPFDFSATVTAIDAVIPDFMAVYEPAGATTYEQYLNDIAAGEQEAR